MSEKYSIVLFDGECNFCNRSVQFIYKRDPQAKFRFASLQSQVGQSLLKKHGLPENTINTMVLIENERAYIKSTAALRIAKKLKGGWPLLFVFIIVPAFIRNFFYDLVARNRHKLAGKQKCELPDSSFQSRILS